MNDHHFSYPVVVPLGAMTISGHSNSPAPSLGSPQAPRRLQPGVLHAIPVLSSPSAAAPSSTLATR
jgi:hypothetical protein